MHGCVDEVLDLLRKVEFMPGDLVLFLGDLVAKGPKSKAVIRYIGYVCMYVCMQHVSLYVCMYVCMYVCIYICVFVCNLFQWTLK